LKGARPGLKRAVVKLNDSFSGAGNAILRFPDGQRRADIQSALKELEFSVPSETPAIYFDKFARMGGIVEEYIEAQEKASPSAQMRISPTGEVVIISTHDQILGGLSGQVFLGCSFPPRTSTAGSCRTPESRSDTSSPVTAWLAASPWISWS